MPSLLSADIDRYIESHSSVELPVLQSLNRRTHTDVLMPQMLSGQVQGNFLQMITAMLQPQRVLEIGTYTGYTAICFASEMPNTGIVHTIDINEELSPIISEYVEDAGLSDKIVLHLGDATQIIPTIDEVFDLVFIDADKINYSNYYKLVIDKVRPGGYILADNVLWSGKIIDTVKDKDTTALDEFNKLVQSDDRVTNVLVSVRDGIMMIRKKLEQ